MTTYLTVVYTINDKKAFEPTADAIFSNLKASSENEKFAITAVSLDNEIARIEIIRELLDEAVTQDGCFNPEDVLRTVVNHADIGNIKDLQELY